MSLPDESLEPGPLPFLPRDRAEAVSGWGQSWRTVGYVYRPINAGGIRDVFALARANDLHVGLRVPTGREEDEVLLALETQVVDLLDRLPAPAFGAAGDAVVGPAGDQPGM